MRKNVPERERRLKGIRKKVRGVNVSALSQRSGVSERTLFNILHKPQHLPEMATLTHLERFLQRMAEVELLK